LRTRCAGSGGGNRTPLHKLARQIWAYATLKRVTWLEQDCLAACRYPRTAKALRELAEQGVTVLVNLHERPHSPTALAGYGLTELHLPVPDFTPPTPEQLEHGIAALEQAIADGQKVAVHCGAGLGRTGTLLACYLVKRGFGPDAAIARVRAARPGSVETPQQELAVRSYARQIGRG
jgi:atypical dual specificity phosphatase